MTKQTVRRTVDFLAVPNTGEIAVRTLAEAAAAAKQFGQGRVDFKIHADKIRFDGRGFTFRNPGRAMRGRAFSGAAVEKRAVQNLVQILDAESLGSAYILNSPTEVAEWNLNYWLQNTDKVLTVRGYEEDGGNGPVVRSFGSERYNVNIDTAEVLEQMKRVTYYNKDARRNVRLFPDEMPVIGRISRDRTSLRIPFPNINIDINDRPGGGRSQYQAGVILRNGETSNGRFRFEPYAMRTACENSLYVPEWNKTMGIAKNHVGSATAAIVVAEAIEALGNMLNPDVEDSLHSIMDDLAQAAVHELTTGEVLHAIGQFTKVFGASEEDAMNIAQFATEYKPSRIGVANAITQFAHLLPSVMEDSANEMAGRYLFTGKFGTLDDEAVEYREDSVIVSR